jgi:hypothetical protein
VILEEVEAKVPEALGKTSKEIVSGMEIVRVPAAETLEEIKPKEDKNKLKNRITIKPDIYLEELLNKYLKQTK